MIFLLKDNFEQCVLFLQITQALFFALSGRV